MYTEHSTLKPLIPHFHIAKLGYAGVYLFCFMFDPKHTLLVSKMYDSSINIRNIEICPMIFFLIFTSEKNLNILYGYVFVMRTVTAEIILPIA